MWEKIKSIFGYHKPAPPRPSEIAVDQRAQDLVGLGNKMLATDDLVGAAEAYESALRLDGHSAEAWHRRGRIFLRNGQLMGAMACYARSLELDTRHAEVWSALGEAILEFLRKDSEPLFIRENRLEIVCEAHDCFERALKIGGDLPKAKEGRESCRSMMKDSPSRIANPRLFTFHSGSILEEAKREVVSPFLRPSDYRRSRSDP